MTSARKGKAEGKLSKLATYGQCRTVVDEGSLGEAGAKPRRGDIDADREVQYDLSHGLPRGLRSKPREPVQEKRESPAVGQYRT